jgi:small subunit ribosomal protein S4
MAKNRQPIAKRCKALGISPAVMGYSKKTTIRNPGNGMRRKQSEYATQLKEKQKLKFIYGVLEHQFASYFDMAERQTGMTGENLLRLLERRLDNVVFRLGFASPRRDARQLVNHGHFTVNGKKVNIPSYLVKAGDVIAVVDKSKENGRFKLVKEEGVYGNAPKWLEVDAEKLTAKVVALPTREDIDYPVEEHLIVEFYSR